MNALAYWAITAAGILVLAGIIGRRVTYVRADGTEGKGSWLGVLIDERQRFSLTHLQIVLWSLLVLSLLAAMFLARWIGGVSPGELLKIQIPPEILSLAGISGGSAVVATAIKSPRTQSVRTQSRDPKTNKRNPTQFSQVFMVEEGENIDKVIDVTKFQNFFLTLIAVAAYGIMTAAALATTPVPSAFPGFTSDLLWLIGISHAAYVGGKFPEKK